jgi:hypothetical protein
VEKISESKSRDDVIAYVELISEKLLCLAQAAEEFPHRSEPLRAFFYLRMCYWKKAHAHIPHDKTICRKEDPFRYYYNPWEKKSACPYDLEVLSQVNDKAYENVKQHKQWLLETSQTQLFQQERQEVIERIQKNLYKCHVDVVKLFDYI